MSGLKKLPFSAVQKRARLLHTQACDMHLHMHSHKNTHPAVIQKVNCSPLSHLSSSLNNQSLSLNYQSSSLTDSSELFFLACARNVAVTPELCTLLGHNDRLWPLELLLNASSRPHSFTFAAKCFLSTLATGLQTTCATHLLNRLIKFVAAR